MLLLRETILSRPEFKTELSANLELANQSAQVWTMGGEQAFRWPGRHKQPLQLTQG